MDLLCASLKRQFSKSGLTPNNADISAHASPHTASFGIKSFAQNKLCIYLHPALVTVVT